MSERDGALSMNDCTLPREEKQPQAGEYIDLCELCGSSADVQPTADADYGQLHLCSACRTLFGFEVAEGADDGN